MSATIAGYDIPDDLLDLRATIRQIADERIAPRAAEIDRSGEYPQDIRQLLAENDIFALPFDVEYGGTDTGTLMLQMAVEAIARADASCALMLMLQELGTLPIARYGSEELKTAVSAEVRIGRLGASVRAVGGRGRVERRGDAHNGGSGRRSLGDQRDQELDL